MADGLAPAIDKVGQPAPGAPEAEAGAPAVPTISEPEKPEVTPEETKVAGLDGAGPKVGLPKPVEVMSVPETPINGNTPAGGTPRPVLNTLEEPTSAPSEPEPVVMTGVESPAATASESKPEPSAIVEPAAADAPVAAVNGTAAPAPATATGAATEVAATKTQPETDAADEAAKADAETTIAGDKKRKLDEEPSAAPLSAPASSDAPIDKPANISASAINGTGDEPAEKKTKIDHDEAVASAPATNGKAAKKETKKVAPPAIGKTARKTRSQGPVEV
jgi:hypothetical protein